MTAPTTSAGAALKPCPFCGGGAAPGTIRYSDHHAKSQGWDQTLFHYINCMSCGASNQGLIGKRTPEAAAAHWNRRIEFSRVEAKSTTPPDYQADVRAFHEALVPDQVADRPTMPPGKIINLRLDLIEEEFGELWAALHRGDLVAVADALADLLYVTYGTAVACGIDIAPIWREVHRSNMAKEGGPTRADGKILKPEGWTPPDVRGELIRQGWRDPADAATTVQPTPRGTGREITPLVVADLEARSRIGAEKYGEPLRAHNGRDALVDLYQEILDAACYIKQVLEERTENGGGDNE